jgi:ribonuclease D
MWMAIHWRSRYLEENLSNMTYQYIEQAAQLQQVVDVCSSASVIAVDTEFARTDTYYPIVGLIQIYDGNQCYLIDPLAVTDLSPLKGLMSSPDTLKLFHACSEDIEVFQRCMGINPAPMFDTQIAAAALGTGFSMSYQRLVEHYLEITVPKEETRSDWLQRPLTTSQIKYAALDVIYLFEVYGHQKTRLQQLNRSHWVTEDCEAMGTDIPTMADPDKFYLKLKGISRFDRHQLNVLKKLCAWREILAREKDVPRNRVVDQKAILAIAKYDLFEKDALQLEANMSRGQVRRYGDDIIAIANGARLQDEEECPPIITKDRTPIDNSLLKKLKEAVESYALESGISPELLVKRRHLEALMKSSVLPAGLQGWRKEVVGTVLLDVLAVHS